MVVFTRVRIFRLVGLVRVMRTVLVARLFFVGVRRRLKVRLTVERLSVGRMSMKMPAIDQFVQPLAEQHHPAVQHGE